MTNPKTPEPGAAAPRPKPAEASTSDSPPSPDRPHNGQNALLEQLVALTRSIGDLVQQNAATATSTADPDQQARVVFAYDFLGFVLGRRAPSVFQLTAVTVIRNDHNKLTFTGLGKATAAKVRAADNHVQLLKDLTDDVGPIEIQQNDKDNQPISSDQPIDSIVTFTSLGGTPVAIGPCLPAVVGTVIE